MKIPTVRIKFKYNYPVLILEEKEYKRMCNGRGFFGFCSEMGITAKEVVKVEHLLMKPEDYPTEEWCP